MSNGQIAVPTTLDAFYFALGEAVEQAVSQPDCLAWLVQIHSMAQASSDEAQSCGIWWCAVYAEQMKNLGVIAQRAMNDEQDTTSLMSDIFSTNLSDVRTFLTTCQPDYLPEVFLAGTMQEDQTARTAFLQLLVDLGQALERAFQSAKS